MPNVKLYINNQLMDLSGDESINVDYAIFDITKIGKRGGARSYEFKLPKTNLNKRVLENPEIVNNLSTIPYQRLQCLVLVDGVDVLIRFAEVSSVKDSYNVRVYGGNSDLFTVLKDLKLSSLDLSEYNHFWTLENIHENIINYVAGTTTGYVYAIIDYHSDSPNSYINNNNAVLRVDYLLPSIFINTVLEKIFTQFGYTFDNEIAGDTENVILPATFDTKIRNKNGGRYIAKFATYGTKSILDFTPYNPLLASQFNSIPLTEIITENEVYFEPKFGSGLVYELLFADVADISVTVTMDVTNTGGVQDFYISLCGDTRTVNAQPGVNSYVFYFDVRVIPTGGPPAPFGGFIILPPELLLENRFIFLAYTSILTADLNITNFIVEITSSNIIEAGEVDYFPLPNPEQVVRTFTDNYITPSTIITDITQMDLAKDYMGMFSLLPNINENTKHISLIRFSSLLANISKAYNWSDIIDETEDYNLEFVLNSYAQNNYFRYTEDGEEPKPTGTDGAIGVDNLNLEFEKDVVKLKFAATNRNKRLVDVDVCQIGIYENGEARNKKKPRILNVVTKELDTVLELTDLADTSVASSAPVPYFIDDDQIFNLGFENNLLETYYDLLSNILNRVKIIKLDVRLSAADISQLDFSRPVWIAKFESYFYISSVKGFSYTENKSTSVELVKLNING